MFRLCSSFSEGSELYLFRKETMFRKNRALRQRCWWKPLEKGAHLSYKSIMAKQTNLDLERQLRCLSIASIPPRFVATSHGSNINDTIESFFLFRDGTRIL